MSTAAQDPVSATLERSLERFAQKNGLASSETTENPTKKEAGGHEMATVAARTKTANEGEVADPGQGGSQVQTMHDAGDYDPDSKVVNETKSDVAEHAKDGTPELGNQSHSSNYDDKSYPQSGDGAAKLAGNRRAIAAVLSIAGHDPKAAAKLIHAVDGDGGGPGGDKGNTVGGEPASVTDGLAAAEDPGAAPAEIPPPAVSTAPQSVPQDDIAKSKLQESVDSRQQALDVDKQVLQELNTVLEDVTAVRKKRAAKDEEDKKKKDKEKAEKEKKEKEAKLRRTAEADKEKKEKEEKEKKEAARRQASTTSTRVRTAAEADEREPPMVEQGDGKVPHASVDPENHPQTDGDPDKTGAQEMREASTPTGEGHAGQQFSESGDRDYKHAIKDLTARVARAKEIMATKVNDMVKGGMKVEAALERLAKTEFGRKLATATSQLRDMEKKAADDGNNRDSSGNVPPNEITTQQADDTVRYDSKERGDDKKDDIAQGTDDRLESPETGGVVDEARGDLTRKHNDDTAGSTVAVKTDPKMAAKILAEVVTFEKAASVIANMGKEALPHVMTAEAKKSVATSVQRTTETLTKIVAVIKGLMSKKALTQVERSLAARYIHEGRVAVAMAKDNAQLLSAQVKEGAYHKAKFARVSPSFKLAAEMVSSNTIKLAELPAQVAEFINMSPDQFQASEKMAMKVASRRSPPQGSQFPSRLASIGRDSALPTASGDELDGIFDD